MLKAIAALIFLGFAAPALGATVTLSAMDGRVLVNTGAEFSTSQVGQVLQTGDRVMVPAGGFATLTFDDGCEYTVQPDTLVTVPSESPCKGGVVQVQQVTPPNTVPTQVGTRPYAGDDWFAWGAGTAALLLLLLDGESDDDTASP